MFRALIPIRIDWRLFISLTLGFIAFTIIGTVSHEAGHWAVGRYLGLKRGSIHYGYTSPGVHPLADSLRNMYYAHEEQIKQNQDFPGKQQYLQQGRRFNQDYMWVTVGGPAQTMLFGSLGLSLLLYRHRKRSTPPTVLLRTDWLLILLALFWLRQPTNLTTKLAGFIRRGRTGNGDDETWLNHIWGLPDWTLLTVTGMIGLIILTVIIFRFIPAHQRLTFITAGLTGGVAGYGMWLEWLGPVLMP